MSGKIPKRMSGVPWADRSDASPDRRTTGTTALATEPSEDSSSLEATTSASDTPWPSSARTGWSQSVASFLADPARPALDLGALSAEARERLAKLVYGLGLSSPEAGVERILQRLVYAAPAWRTRTVHEATMFYLTYLWV